MPAFADSLGGAGVYGILLMAQAFGSLLGAILAPYLKLERLPLGYILPERSVYRAPPGVSAYLPLGLGLSFWCTVWHGFPEGLRTLSSIRSFRRQYPRKDWARCLRRLADSAELPCRLAPDRRCPWRGCGKLLHYRGMRNRRVLCRVLLDL